MSEELESPAGGDSVFEGATIPGCRSAVRMHDAVINQNWLSVTTNRPMQRGGGSDYGGAGDGDCGGGTDEFQR